MVKDTMTSSTGEIILYQPDDTIRLEVRMEDETVWLTQAQMAELFRTTRNNVTLHISNIFKEEELSKDSVCKKSLLTASDGKRYITNIYNLDVIISVGYRVKSKRGTQFRQWASKVLKEYLIRGFSVNQRIERLEQRVAKTEEKIDFFVKTSLPPQQGIFFDGQIFDAFRFVSDLIHKAQQRIALIDNYVDDTVLILLDKRNDGVSATIESRNHIKRKKNRENCWQFQRNSVYLFAIFIYLTAMEATTKQKTRNELIDFMFEVSHEELLKCQIGTSSWGSSKYGTFAFTVLGLQDSKIYNSHDAE